jgi:hypothetical protein
MWLGVYSRRCDGVLRGDSVVVVESVGEIAVDTYLSDYKLVAGHDWSRDQPEDSAIVAHAISCQWSTRRAVAANAVAPTTFVSF